ncbi:MAG TPA: hypothetical protein VK626_01835 [Nitrospiraceae bacterium]|nr:hypothetical protein [Nitrospiraceae bacterium]
MTGVEEHSWSPEGPESGQVKLARLWVYIDGAVHDLKTWIGKLKSVRGPEDYEKSDSVMIEFLEKMNRVLERRPANYQNGDDGSNESVKKWLAGFGASLTLIVIVAAWSQSNQLATITTKVEDIRERIKAQDDRIARLELQQANERSRIPTAP